MLDSSESCQQPIDSMKRQAHTGTNVARAQKRPQTPTIERGSWGEPERDGNVLDALTKVLSLDGYIHIRARCDGGRDCNARTASNEVSTTLAFSCQIK